MRRSSSHVSWCSSGCQQRQQQADSVALQQAVMVSWLLCTAVTRLGVSVVDEEDAQALLPLVQPLAGLLACESQEEEQVMLLARCVLRHLAHHSQPLMAAVS